MRTEFFGQVEKIYEKKFEVSVDSARLKEKVEGPLYSYSLYIERDYRQYFHLK